MKSLLRWLLPAAFTAFLTAGAFGAPNPDDGSELRLAIVVTRHGVRSPLDRGGLEARFSAEAWPAWEVPAGYLTPHGKEQMQILGRYYRALYEKEGLLDPVSGRSAVYFRSDNDQRTKETARDLAQAWMPGPEIEIHSRPQGQSDALFSPLKAHLGNPDRRLGVAAVLGRLGGNAASILGGEAEEFAALERILSGGKPLNQGKVTLLSLPSAVNPDTGPDLVQMSGPLRAAMICIDDFILEYGDNKPLAQVGWGRVGAADITQLLELHSLYFDLTQRTPYCAQVMGSNLAMHILETLQQGASGHRLEGAIGGADARLVFVVGHDSNIANLGGLLGLNWWLPGSQRDPLLPGGALVFELRQRKADGAWLVRAHYLAQSLDQMRSATALSPESPPDDAPIFIPGCSEASPGFDAPLEAFAAKLKGAIDPGFVQASAE